MNFVLLLWLTFRFFTEPSMIRGNLIDLKCDKIKPEIRLKKSA